MKTEMYGWIISYVLGILTILFIQKIIIPYYKKTKKYLKKNKHKIIKLLIIISLVVIVGFAVYLGYISGSIKIDPQP